MTEFDYDCLQKKVVARSARRRVGLRRRATLPSDSLDAAQIAGRNGPCRTYHLGGPMDGSQFRTMPVDLQRVYLRRLRSNGGSQEAVARMLGFSWRELEGLMSRCHVRFDCPDDRAWQDFLAR